MLSCWMDRGKFGTRVGDPVVLPAASLRSPGTVQPASPSIDPSCLVQIKIPFPLPFQHMVKAICAELGVERNSFGEQVVYRECQLSFLGVERTEFGQQTGQMSTRTPSRRGQSLGVQTVGFRLGNRDTHRRWSTRPRRQPLSEKLPRAELSPVQPRPQRVGQWPAITLRRVPETGVTKDFFEKFLANVEVPAQPRHVILGIQATQCAGGRPAA